jgi:hypothetical protein
MMNDHFAVPFSIEGVNSGFTAVNGLAKIEDKALKLEFQTADAIIGVVKSDLKMISIPFSSIRKIELKKGWFSSKIILQTKSMSDLKSVPGAKSGFLELKIKKAHKLEAIELNSHFQLEFSEYRLAQME